MGRFAQTDGKSIGTTAAFKETEGYLDIAVSEGIVSSTLDGTEALSASIEPRDGWRYVAYLHEGPEGAPAVMWTTGHVREVASGTQYLRIVTLIPRVVGRDRCRRRFKGMEER